MHRLFLDANVLFSAAYKADARVSRLWTLSGVVLCSSHYAMEEARSNLEEGAQITRLTRLSAKVRLFDATGSNSPRETMLPHKDLPILLAAIEARATHLLTGDVRHFGQYFGRKIGEVKIMLPGEYLRGRKY